ncbi:MAPEG family protein [Thalassotalea hakodatensis]|uniref:MAPEG family protein n=1 Tax=Thalassotalea hakodatensis TaxID=3030492 RepID=UPI002572FC3B|nr:MAPEG family protein [Thalassotalea hakodatensis]
MDAIKILQPIIIMGLHTLIITIYMFITRISAMKKLKIHPEKGQDTSNLKLLLPAEVNRISNNYNHLFEQPTLFYAVVLLIALLGHVDTLSVICAWSYVAVRVIHSLIQITIDRVLIRFYLFLFSWLILAAMLIKEAKIIFF